MAVACAVGVAVGNGVGVACVEVTILEGEPEAAGFGEAVAVAVGVTAAVAVESMPVVSPPSCEVPVVSVGVRAEMEEVPAGGFPLYMPGLDHLDTEPTASFLVDRHPVTNRDFKRFVDDGGYTRREFWREPFRDGPAR